MTSTIGTVHESSYDLVIIGGGPGGSTLAALLAREGLRVAVFEREAFPRFHVGESLLPANLPIFDRLGCHDRLRQAGFICKPGVTLYDEYEARDGITFTFPQLPSQPDYAYQVPRAPFDDLLLRHAENMGASVFRQHDVKRTQHDPGKVVVHVNDPQGQTLEVEAHMVVDASGRAAFLSTSYGHREALPDLGKVALFAHFQGIKRQGNIPEGNTRLYLVPQGWLWWFSFSDGTDSIGCILHAQVVKDRRGTIEDLFDEVLAASPRLAAGLVQGQRTTPVHTVANFSYRVQPCIGDRYLAIGDAAGFIDPIFSTGVFLAMRSAELASQTIVKAFEHGDFTARALRPYAARLRRGIAPFLPFIRRFYEPAFLDIFFTQRPPLRLDQPVLWVFSGAAFDNRPLWLRLGLVVFFGIVQIRKFIRWATGRQVASRQSW